MNTPTLGAARWRKSSYSNGGDGNCLEVADGFPGVVPVRDSKNPTTAALVVPVPAWSTFVSAIRDGELPGA